MHLRSVTQKHLRHQGGSNKHTNTPGQKVRCCCHASCGKKPGYSRCLHPWFTVAQGNEKTQNTKGTGGVRGVTGQLGLFDREERDSKKTSTQALTFVLSQTQHAPSLIGGVHSLQVCHTFTFSALSLASLGAWERLLVCCRCRSRAGSPAELEFQGFPSWEFSQQSRGKTAIWGATRRSEARYRANMLARERHLPQPHARER